jgi:hypothetical protein
MSPSVDAWSKGLKNTTNLVAGRSWSGESNIASAGHMLIDIWKMSHASSSTVK